MSDKQGKLGLVLTGGGAKGAYHVGAIQAIAELGIPVHGVAGASIGALNGAIVATAKDMTEAHRNMHDIWQTLASDKVVAMSARIPAYLTMMAGMGIAFRAMPVLSFGLSVGGRLAKEFGLNSTLIDGELLDDSPLVNLLNKNVSTKALKNGLPLFVSVYESGGAANDILNVLKAGLRFDNTQESDFLHVQSLQDSEMQQVLMASAALPLLFRSRTVGGRQYTDGGQGDWYGVGGNTPVKPLVEAGYETIIVVHLNDGSAWDRNQYPDTNIIEVRPGASIARGNMATDLLGFDHSRINSWIEQGYEDSMHSLRRVFDTIGKHNRLKQSREHLENSLKQHETLDGELNRAMSKLKNMS